MAVLDGCVNNTIYVVQLIADNFTASSLSLVADNTFKLCVWTCPA